jgi:hypothetical protein
MGCGHSNDHTGLWRSQAGQKRRYCAPPVEVVAGGGFLFPRLILLDGGDPRFPGWGVAWLELAVVFFLYFVDAASDSKHVCRQWSPVGAGLLQAAKGLQLCQCSDAA